MDYHQRHQLAPQDHRASGPPTIKFQGGKGQVHQATLNDATGSIMGVDLTSYGSGPKTAKVIVSDQVIKEVVLI